MRPSAIFSLAIIILIVCDAVLAGYGIYRKGIDDDRFERLGIAVSAMGLSDLCVATEARYTRNPAVSDPVVPFMDHPGAIEHFPTGSFLAPPLSFP